MKKAIILFFLVSFYNFGQESSFFYLGMANTVSNKLNSDFYNVSEIFTGKHFQLKNGTINFDGAYRFSGNMNSYNNHGYKYQFKSHLIGGNITYKLWSEKRRFRPHISISLFTEFATNYNYGSLEKNYLIPARPFNESFTSYSARFYQGTPIVANLFFGFSTHLISSLYLSVSIGLGYDRLKTKYATWHEEYNVILEDKLKDKPIDFHSIYSYNFQIGLQYMFSFKKSAKPK